LTGWELSGEVLNMADVEKWQKADTLFGIYCDGNPASVPEGKAIFWKGWQRLEDYIAKHAPDRYAEGLEKAAQIGDGIVTEIRTACRTANEDDEVSTAMDLGYEITGAAKVVEAIRRALAAQPAPAAEGRKDPFPPACRHGVALTVFCQECSMPSPPSAAAEEEKE
jgi:hypothetical protein